MILLLTLAGILEGITAGLFATHGNFAMATFSGVIYLLLFAIILKD